MGGRMCRLIAVLCASVISSVPAQAANDSVKIGPVPSWAGQMPLLPVPDAATGLLFLRGNELVVHLDANGQQSYQAFRAKILHANGLQVGNLSLAWNPAFGSPVIHAVKIHRQAETFDVLKKASFEVLRREDQLEEAMLTGNLTAVMRVPDLRVGDELEVAWTTRQNDPTLGPLNAGSLLLSHDPAQGRFRVGINWEDGQKPNFKVSRDLTAQTRIDDRSLALQLDNPPALVAAKDAPVRYAWQRIIEYSDYSDWASVSRTFDPLFKKAAALSTNSPVKQEAAKIAARYSNPLERAAAALELVQREVRYIYVGLNGGNFTPATADATWQRRYGDCKGKTALLMALLNELGIPSEAILVNTKGLDDGLEQRLPNPEMFDHVLVRSRIGGADYFLDGTLPHVAVPSVRPSHPYRWVLPLSVAGATIQPIRWSAPTLPDSIQLYEIDARSGFDKPAKIIMTNIVRGLKGLEQQVQLSAASQAELLGAFQQNLGEPWASVDDVKWHFDIKSQASILTISGTGTIDWDDEDDGGKGLSLPGGGFSPPDKKARPASKDQDIPFANSPEFSCHVTTVRLPSSTDTSKWTVNSSFDTMMFGKNYYRAFGFKDGAIRMIRGYRVYDREIEVALANRDNGRIAQFDNSMARIEYYPKGRGNLEEVGFLPATYDIDWSAGSVPCLSTTALTAATD